MEAAAESQPLFLVGLCRGCDKEVLTHTHYDEEGAEVRLCLECDAVVADGIRPTSADALDEWGYRVGDAASGCGKPGCGGGRCGRP